MSPHKAATKPKTKPKTPPTPAPLTPCAAPAVDELVVPAAALPDPETLEEGGLVVAGLVVAAALLPVPLALPLPVVVPVVCAKLVVAVVVVPNPLPVVVNGPVLVWIVNTAAVEEYARHSSLPTFWASARSLGLQPAIRHVATAIWILDFPVPHWQPWSLRAHPTAVMAEERQGDWGGRC